MVKKSHGKNQELQPISRTMIVNLHKQLHKTKFKSKAPQAIKVIKKLVSNSMFTKDVRIDPELNKELWRSGVRNVTRRVEVIMERKKNEEDEEAEEKMYTLVRLVPKHEAL